MSITVVLEPFGCLERQLRRSVYGKIKNKKRSCPIVVPLLSLWCPLLSLWCPEESLARPTRCDWDVHRWLRSKGVCMGVDYFSFFSIFPNNGRWGQQCAYQSLRSHVPALWASWGDSRRWEESDPPSGYTWRRVNAINREPWTVNIKHHQYNLSATDITAEEELY